MDRKYEPCLSALVRYTQDTVFPQVCVGSGETRLNTHSPGVAQGTTQTQDVVVTELKRISMPAETSCRCNIEMSPKSIGGITNQEAV